ncbi:hypothetical protein A3K34_01945 [candidate division WWE3 bacterium RIFOXYC1_FULL_40_10]|uniref:Uncharacterized protein n=1 Tax=candidate division WWE3 bacterium RIFOXYA2_FULL_46_9 TaxID=1802636 RepID=A0A1F4VZT1_UNCKA|nr:MAG: hypothetical protein A3K58_01945 [candidate division WWE3 bacterium RIFOXYB1_FULL_40_22]OGC61623.1 MAG: hypothetical protein A3K37_01945 [candidate division WWE3 bacterium RIFOXYA1_FULL_40_11]OGC62672.1 MAG: hypothetical protein A2264_02270 [candidate division WWE3 bacterium RIFOXYA2_FULL_46_9]OGC64700.1 MAG: hypothetical protein A2326_01500 [candidate division WWE3 bacterium RIFOXYB2_FULL_41_6]OGC66006.1 MAG: hypothetical protein A3K34_01945 [candidate division WWE3 bacterium RIFOXYC1_
MIKQKGNLPLIILIAIGLAVLALSYYFSVNRDKPGFIQVNPDQEEEFTKLNDDSKTPKEADNSAIEELDQLVENIDSTPKEDISDLE